MSDQEELILTINSDKDKESEEDYCTDSVKDLSAVNKGPSGSIDDEIDELSRVIQLGKQLDLVLTPYEEEKDFQERIDIIISQVKTTINYMNAKCEMIEKMNMLMCILTYKIYDLQHEFNVKLDALQEQRETIILLNKEDENLVNLELLDLDRNMRELQLCHHEKSKGYLQQKIDMQMEYEKLITLLDAQLENLKKCAGILTGEHSDERRSSDPVLVDFIVQAALEECNASIEKFDIMHKKGWKNLYGDEEILDNLHSRGLAVSKSGYILTEDGDKLSYTEADKRNLLQGLDLKNKLLPKRLKTNEDILAMPSSAHTLQESESLTSQISTEDVCYLKETLGKPLTLALAEITTKQPRDPIHYLGHWLFKYRYNQELDITQKQEYESLMLERNRLLREKLHRLYEEEAKLVIFEMINSAENEAIRKELERILREQMAGEDEENDHSAMEYAELKKLLNMIQKTT